jgi:hypothetical protein
MKELGNRMRDAEPSIRHSAIKGLGKVYGYELARQWGKFIPKDNKIKLESGKTRPYFAALLDLEIIRPAQNTDEWKEWNHLKVAIDKLAWVPGAMMEHLKKFNIMSDVGKTIGVIDQEVMPWPLVASLECRVFALMFALGQIDLEGESNEALGIHSYIKHKSKAQRVVAHFLADRDLSKTKAKDNKHANREGKNRVNMEKHHEQLAALITGIDSLATAVKVGAVAQFRCAMDAAECLQVHPDANVFKDLKIMCDPLQDGVSMAKASKRLRSTFKKDEKKEAEFLHNLTRRLSLCTLNHEVFREVLAGVCHFADSRREGTSKKKGGSERRDIKGRASVKDICASSLQFLEWGSIHFPQSFAPNLDALMTMSKNTHTPTASTALKMLYNVVPLLTPKQLQTVVPMEGQLEKTCLADGAAEETFFAAKILCRLWQSQELKKRKIKDFLAAMTSVKQLSSDNKQLSTVLTSLAKFAKYNDVAFDSPGVRVIEFLKDEMLGDWTQTAELKDAIDNGEFKWDDICAACRVRCCHLALFATGCCHCLTPSPSLVGMPNVYLPHQLPPPPPPPPPPGCHQLRKNSAWTQKICGRREILESNPEANHVLSGGFRGSRAQGCRHYVSEASSKSDIREEFFFA